MGWCAPLITTACYPHTPIQPPPPSTAAAAAATSPTDDSPPTAAAAAAAAAATSSADDSTPNLGETVVSAMRHVVGGLGAAMASFNTSDPASFLPHRQEQHGPGGAASCVDEGLLPAEEWLIAHRRSLQQMLRSLGVHQSLPTNESAELVLPPAASLAKVAAVARKAAETVEEAAAAAAGAPTPTFDRHGEGIRTDLQMAGPSALDDDDGFESLAALRRRLAELRALNISLPYSHADGAAWEYESTRLPEVARIMRDAKQYLHTHPSYFHSLTYARARAGEDEAKLSTLTDLPSQPHTHCSSSAEWRAEGSLAAAVTYAPAPAAGQYLPLLVSDAIARATLERDVETAADAVDKLQKRHSPPTSSLGADAVRCGDVATGFIGGVTPRVATGDTLAESPAATTPAAEGRGVPGAEETWPDIVNAETTSGDALVRGTDKPTARAIPAMPSLAPPPPPPLSPSPLPTRPPDPPPPPPPPSPPPPHQLAVWWASHLMGIQPAAVAPTHEPAATMPSFPPVPWPQQESPFVTCPNVIAAAQPTEPVPSAAIPPALVPVAVPWQWYKLGEQVAPLEPATRTPPQAQRLT